MRPESGFRIVSNWSLIRKMTMTSLTCFWLVFTDPSFMSISWLVLKLWQFLFIRDSPEIRNSEKIPSEFCPVSGDWGEWRTPNLARTSLIKCYWILQNPRVTTLTVSELLRENQQGGKITSHPPRLGLRNIQRTISMLLDTRFRIWLIMTLYYKMWQILLQNATAILLQNASGFLLQNVTVLLQNATVITNCDSFITNCDSTVSYSQNSNKADTQLLHFAPYSNTFFWYLFFHVG